MPVSEEQIMLEIDKIIKNVSSNINESPQPTSELANINILDVYEMLLETNRQLTTTLDGFRLNLETANDSTGVNTSIMHFTRDFYKIRKLLTKHSNIYNDIHFTSIEEAAIGKKYMRECLTRKDRDKCLHELAHKKTH